MNGAKRRYRENKVYQLRVDLYRNTDATLIAHLEKAWSKAAFVKKACLRDIPRVVTIKQGKYYCPACNRAYTPVQDSYSYCPYCGTHVIHFDLYTAVDTGSAYTAEATPEASAEAYTAVDTGSAYTAVDTAEATPEASAEAYTAVDTGSAYTAVDTAEATPEAYPAVDTDYEKYALEKAIREGGRGDVYSITYTTKRGGETQRNAIFRGRNAKEAIQNFREWHKAHRETFEGHAFRPNAKRKFGKYGMEPQTDPERANEARKHGKTLTEWDKEAENFWRNL